MNKSNVDKFCNAWDMIRGYAITRDDVIEFSDHNVVDGIYRNFAKMREGFTYQCFAKFGFTKEWLHDSDNIKRVKIYSYEKPGNVYREDLYSVDNIDVFSIVTAVSDDLRGFVCKMYPLQTPTEVKIIFGFPIEEDSDDPN